MDWFQFFGILVPLVTLFGFLYKEIKECRREIQEEVRIQSERLDRICEIQSERTDRLYEAIQQQNCLFQEDMKLQTQRTDTLYQMFIDLLNKQISKTTP